MFKAVFSIYKWKFAETVVYMLQASEYDVPRYLSWLWRVNDFDKVSYRGNLIKTKPARVLLVGLRLGMLAQVAIGIFLFAKTSNSGADLGMMLAVLFVLSTPIVWTNLVVFPLWVGKNLVTRPIYSFRIWQSRKVFASHKGLKIAIAGSYGKTTTKEILKTVLGEGKKVVATPANRNVAISHARFASSLKGDEDVLILEYGEGAPGDIAKFAKNTNPDVGVITGLAPAHMDKYKTLEATGKDIFSLTEYLSGRKLYVNIDGDEVKPFLKKSYVTFSSRQTGRWSIGDIKIDYDGTSFTMKSGKREIKLRSRLIGRHQLAPLSLAVLLADELGLDESQIKSGVAKVEPFEHRMQTYQLSGAWVVDDTYNGNIEGMRAGLELMKELPAKRKIYVTPGLVDQGSETASIHKKLGDLIKSANPDQVILMKNSVTDFIKTGLDGYKGQLIIEDDPLNFYSNLDKFVAAGDLLVMQNDWPDQYR